MRKEIYMSVTIITGSTADLSKDVIDRLVVIPQMVHFGEKEYIDGVTMTSDEFYDYLQKTNVPPKSSHPSPQAYRDEYEKAIAKGDDIVVITISSKLSGTLQSATLAAEGLDNVYVVDSKSASIGEGILCELALRLADEGKSAAEIAEIITRERENIVLIGVLDTLEYLQRGGRISRTKAFVGALLSIKPLITNKDGAVATLGRARGSKKAYRLMIEEIKKVGGIDFQKPVLFAYSGRNDDKIKKFIEENNELWGKELPNPEYVHMGSVIGTHAGPGAVVVAFYKKG